MKKEFRLKLTLCLVSLFISLLLVILGNKNNYCLSFGFILLGISIALLAMDRSDLIDNAIIEINNEINEVPSDNTFEQKVLSKEKAKLIKKKQKLNFTFYLCAILLVAVGISFMF